MENEVAASCFSTSTASGSSLSPSLPFIIHTDLARRAGFFAIIFGSGVRACWIRAAFVAILVTSERDYPRLTLIDIYSLNKGWIYDQAPPFIIMLGAAKPVNIGSRVVYVPTLGRS